jgi:predicted O-methyltransferase YrrM
VSSGFRRFVIPEFSLIYFTVLEIGTFIGFSTMGWSDAVGPDGHVTALEFSPEYAAIAEEAFAKNGIKNVDVVVGDATES